jgi:CheY-like chemotaxis protein
MGEKALIYVVEDDPANLRLIHDLLSVHGFRVAGLAENQDIMEEIARRPPALILMDISLKGESGLALTKKLKNRNETMHIPIVAITAHTSEQDRQNALAAGCDGFITKPVNTRQLPAQIREICESRQ